MSAERSPFQETWKKQKGEEPKLLPFLYYLLAWSSGLSSHRIESSGRDRPGDRK